MKDKLSTQFQTAFKCLQGKHFGAGERALCQGVSPPPLLARTECNYMRVLQMLVKSQKICIGNRYSHALVMLDEHTAHFLI